MIRDPSGYGGGINLYSYVQNNPGNLDDPMGLCGGDDADPDFWGAVGSGFNVGLNATASALSFGLYDGGDAKCDPDFGTSKTLAGIGRDAAIMAATLGTGGPLVAEDGATALEDAAEEAAERPNPCGGMLCFTADAPVQMADGTTRRIVDVQVGDTIKSRNPLTGLDDAKTVTATIKRLAPAVVTVSVTDARTGTIETLTCTPEHPFFVTGQGWVEAGSLGIGTSLVSRAGPALSVTNVTWHRNAQAEKSAGNEIGGFTVYNLTVEDDHTFFVGTTGGGTWVHNIDCADDLLDKVQQLHDANFPHPIANRMNTTAILETDGGDITATNLNGAHAEPRAIIDALENGLTPLRIGISRAPCKMCGILLDDLGIPVEYLP